MADSIYIPQSENRFEICLLIQFTVESNQYLKNVQDFNAAEKDFNGIIFTNPAICVRDSNRKEESHQRGKHSLLVGNNLNLHKSNHTRNRQEREKKE